MGHIWMVYVIILPSRTAESMAKHHHHHLSSDLATALISFSAAKRVAWALVPVALVWLGVLWALT